MLKSNSRRLKILLGADFIATGKAHKRCTNSQFLSSVRETASAAGPQYKWFNAIIKTTNHWVLTCFLSWSFYWKWYLEATNLVVIFTLRHLHWMQLPPFHSKGHGIPCPSHTREGRVAFSSTASVDVSSPARVAAGCQFHSLGTLGQGRHDPTLCHPPSPLEQYQGPVGAAGS